MQILIWLTSNYWTTWRSTTRWTRTFEGLRGARMFHLVSLSLQISLADLPGPCLGLCVGVACFWLVLFLVGFFLPGKFDFNLMLIPVVDRPCLALVRQCRKKKSCPSSIPTWLDWEQLFNPLVQFFITQDVLCSFLTSSNFSVLHTEQTVSSTLVTPHRVSSFLVDTVQGCQEGAS